ncbi:hypothetical protein GT037_001774 [Alternaria burnsii]|uniref:Uncharacterized protein n=1 Tax=Alternaria burnsii TaxID=1187904 RepID=A0A8H7BB50_9PLEO|nr:uncharacterized protein GT037_001774 [Alternaria burnsii]KAF7680123.1 hypothetical protein GT037_001774 [Alternaria burnsii]CAI9628866.1 unnamed protein product [Alternaria burnsii]
MPPKTRKVPGRKAAAAEEAPVAPPLKRSRASRADAVEAAVEPPKKRGRPAKAKAEEPVVEDAPKPKKRGRQSNIAPAPAPAPEPEPLIEAPVVKKGRGRPKKEAVPAREEAPVQEEAPIKNRGGRPRKADVTANAPPATPKRGRPARTAALHLDRVAGPSRIGKRSSPRAKAKAEPNVARRLDPRMRSKLRTRLPSAKTVRSEPVTKPAPKPTARRGRPPKHVAPVPKPAAVEKPTKPAKPLAPRKMRGHTLRQIPDQYVAQVDQYLQDLIEADASPVEEEQLEEIEEQDEDGLVVEEVVEHAQDVLVSSEQDREQYQDYSDDGGAGMDGQQDGVQDDEHDQAVVAQQDQEGAEELPEGVNNDEVPEQTNGIHVVPEDDAQSENAEPMPQIEMNVQEVVEMEQDGAVNVHAEVDTEVVAPENLSEDGMDFFHGAEEYGLISGTPAPPAAVIFS